MGTNLHNIRFPISARIQRIKSMIDLRKTRRSQVFCSHRLRHFFASDDHIRQKFYTICQHLDLVGCNYTDEQKLTVLLLIMVGGDMPQIADFIRYELANELMRHINNERSVLISGICYIVNEINDHRHDDVHYDRDEPAVQTIGARFENENLTFRLNINSITDLMVALVSLLFKSFGDRCQTSHKSAIVITTDLLHVIELCYKHIGHNYMIEHNLNTAILALTGHGAGRLARTKVIVEYKPIMQHVLNRLACNFGNGQELLMPLQIVNNLANGFPENIDHLIRSNLLEHLRNHLVGVDCTTSHEIVDKCLSILDNICGNHRDDIQAVIAADLIAPIKYVFKSSDMFTGIRKSVLSIFVSISTLGNTEQIKALLDIDSLQLMCAQLHNRDVSNDNVIETVLEIITNVLKELYRRDHRTYHQTCSILGECRGFMAISRLIGHSIESISNMAIQLNQYNGNNICEKCDNRLSIDSITIEQMQL